MNGCFGDDAERVVQAFVVILGQAFAERVETVDVDGGDSVACRPC